MKLIRKRKSFRQVLVKMIACSDTFIITDNKTIDTDVWSVCNLTILKKFTTTEFLLAPNILLMPRRLS